MVDTINLRIHDLKINESLVKFLHKRGIEGSERRVKRLDDDFDIVRQMKWQEYTINHATGETYAKSYRTQVKSHNSNISVVVDFDRDFLEIEFSITKYWYGDNVHQLVPHEADGMYSSMRQGNWFDMKPLHWKIFRSLLRSWWERELGSLPFHTDLVEVRRVDFCFNYVFKNENQVKTYLGFIRQIRKKYSREESQQQSYGPSSVYYPSKLATFKIYHKGPELRAHPGAAKKSRYWDSLCELADRTLRFEMGFRPAAMKELWLRRHKEERRFVLAARSWAKDGHFSIGNVRFDAGSKGKDFWLKRGRDLDHAYSFWLRMDDGYDAVKGNVLFDAQLFQDCIQNFYETSKRFMLTSVSHLNIAADRVENYSDGVKLTVFLKGVSATKVRMIEALLRDRSWDEIQRQGIMSRRQLYRYKKIFRELGFGELNSIRGSLTDLDHTYRTYYSSMKVVVRTPPLPF